MSKLHYSVDADGVTVTEYDGESWSSEDAKVLDEQRFAVAEVPAQLETNDEPKSLAAYGLSKVLQERPSGIKGASEKLAAMRDAFAVLCKGKWREYREGSGGGGRGPKLDAIFVQAVADEKKVKVPQAEAALRKMDKATIKQIRNLPSIQKRMDKLREGAGEVDLSFDLSKGDEGESAD